MKKHQHWPLKRAVYFLSLSLMIAMMLARSGVFVIRTLSEIVKPPPPPFHPEIDECSTYLLGTQGQLRGLYNYRSLGKPCQEK